MDTAKQDWLKKKSSHITTKGQSVHCGLEPFVELTTIF